MTQGVLNIAAVLAPLLMLLAGLAFTVAIDSYILRQQRRIMLLVVVLSLSLIVQNFWENALSMGSPMWLWRTAAAVYGYCIRPVILLLFIRLTRPKARCTVWWILVGVNAAIYMTSFFSHLCFWIDEKNHYKAGPLSSACFVISIVLLVYLLLQAVQTSRAADALEWLDDHEADIAFLDINMPDMNGIELAERIKKKSPDTAVIFVTGYAQYAVDAFTVRAAGYLMKPVTREMLQKDVAYVCSLKPDKKSQTHVFVRTFGNFDVFADGASVRFKMAKCKELLAYLVDRQGSSVTCAEISAILWEERLHDRKMQKQLDVYIRSLRDTLREYKIEEIFEMDRGMLRVKPEQFVCDAYLFFSGDTEAVNAYRGEYMSSYSWASMTESVMFWTNND